MFPPKKDKRKENNEVVEAWKKNIHFTPSKGDSPLRKQAQLGRCSNQPPGQTQTPPFQTRVACIPFASATWKKCPVVIGFLKNNTTYNNKYICVRTINTFQQMEVTFHPPRLLIFWVTLPCPTRRSSAAASWAGEQDLVWLPFSMGPGPEREVPGEQGGRVEGYLSCRPKW